MIRILIDSTCDYSAEQQKRLGLTALPLTIHIGGESFRDGVDLDAQGFYQRLRGADRLPTTSQVPPGEFEEAFQRFVRVGDELIVLTISSRLSATNVSAQLAAAQVAPDRIHVVDTMTGSLGAALVVNRAVALRDEGRLTAGEIAEETRALGQRVRIFAALDTLRYLKMGGRLSGSAAFWGPCWGSSQ